MIRPERNVRDVDGVGGWDWRMGLDEGRVFTEQEVVGLVVAGETARINALAGGEEAVFFGETFDDGGEVEVVVRNVDGDHALGFQVALVNGEGFFRE